MGAACGAESEKKPLTIEMAPTWALGFPDDRDSRRSGRRSCGQMNEFII